MGRDDYYENTSKTVDEWNERNIKALGSSLKEGEERLTVTPAFDFRGTKDSKFGQHGVTLHFVKRRGNNAVSTEFYTGLTVDNKPSIMHGKNIGIMCTGLYYHYGLKKHAGEYAYRHEDCPWTNRKRGCYGQAGSSLYGENLLDKLINHGSYAIWKEIDRALDEMESK